MEEGRAWPWEQNGIIFLEHALPNNTELAAADDLLPLFRLLSSFPAPQTSATLSHISVFSAIRTN